MDKLLCFWSVCVDSDQIYDPFWKENKVFVFVYVYLIFKTLYVRWCISFLRLLYQITTNWQTTEFYFLIVPETTRSRSRCHQTVSFRGLWGKNLFPAFLLSPCSLQYPWLKDGILSVSSGFPSIHVYLCLNCFFLYGHQSYWIRAHSSNIILTYSFAVTLLPNKVTFTGIRG